MNLSSDWKWVLKHAWSIRLIAIATILSIIEGTISLAGESYNLPFWIHASLVIAAPFITFVAGIARLIAQKTFVQEETNEQ